MKCSLRTIVWTAALFCLSGAPALAGPIPTPNVQWTYNFTPSQPFVSADTPGTGTVSFTNEPTKGATNTSDIVVTNLRDISTASDTSPATLNTNGAWQVGLTLTDTAANNGAGASTTMYFTGKLGGTFSATNANVTNTFTGLTSQTWTAPNGDQYTVTLSGYTPPGPPSASNAGSISAHVTVVSGVGTSGTAPEPSTLVLSCLGLGFAGLASWRKRRRSLAAVLA